MSIKFFNKINVIKGIFLLMCVTIVAANLNVSQAVKAAETVQDNKIKSGEKEPLVKSGSCEDPSTWIENPKQSTTNSIAYFVKNNNRRFSGTETPITAPEKYLNALCNFAERVNYKDVNGNLLRINNQFVPSIINRDIQDIQEVVENGKLIQKEQNKTISDTYYINTGNDYVAKFPTDPNQGFYFKTNKLYDGIVFEVVKVSIGGKSLKANSPVVKENTIIYPDVLPGVDLKYVLNTNGIAKYFEIKNAEAIQQNDLTSFAFDLADNTKIEKKDEKKDKLQAILESKGVTQELTPTLTKAKEGVELVIETKQVTETKNIPVITTPITSPPVVSSSSITTNSSATPKSSSSGTETSSSLSSSVALQPNSSSSILPPTNIQTTIPTTPLTKSETTTSTQNKTEIEIQVVKEGVKTQIVKELDNKLLKLEEIKKEEESKGDKKDLSLIELTDKTIESTKSVTNEIKSNSINIADEKQISTAIKSTENSSSGSEKLILPNSEDKIAIGLPVIFDRDISKIKTVSSTISQSKDKLTIGVDKDYLISKERQFPIIIDPSIEVKLDAGLFDSGWVSSKNPNGNQNNGNKVRLIAGTPGLDNTKNWTNLGRTESFLSFAIPTGVNIYDAKLKIFVYQTSNNGVSMNVSGLDRNFNHSDLTYDNRPRLSGNFGLIQIGNTQEPQNARMYESNIVKDGKFFMPDARSIGYRQNGTFLFGLSSENGYAWFCSSRAWEYDQYTAPCSNKSSSTPKLEVFYTNPPKSPSSKGLSTADLIGQCNLSLSENKRGDCSVNSFKKFEFNGVESGDGNSEFSNAVNARSNKTGSIISTEDPGLQKREYKTSYSNNNDRQDFINMDLGNGVYKNTFYNEDEFGSRSPFTTEYFQNDNGSPVAYSGIKTEGAKASDGSYLIGRSNPENTQPQVKFTVPDYMDATYNKFSVTPSWDNTLILDIAGGFNPVDFGGGNQGKAIQFLKEKKYNLDAQVFTQDGTVIRANNSDFCWDENQGDNNRLVIAKCTGNDNQKFTYDPSTKQFKLLDQGFEFGNISSISDPSRTLNIWGGNNDNQTRIKMAEKGSSWNTKFRYNRITKEITNQLGKCFDAGNNRNGEDLRIHNCNGGNQQKFNLDAKNRIVNYASRLCVDSYSGDAVGSRQYMGTCHEGMNQKFKVEIISFDRIKEITIANAKNCVDGSSGYTALYVKPCSDSIYQKFDYSTESIVRITAPGGKNDKGFTYNSATFNALGKENANGIPEGSFLYSNTTSMNWQSMRYHNASKTIRTNENLCLQLESPNFTKVIFTKECGRYSNVMVEEQIINGNKTIGTIYPINGKKYCLTTDSIYGGSKEIYGKECSGGDFQKFEFENYQKYLFPSNEMKYQARISESQDGATGATIVIPWQSSPVFQFNSDQNLSEAFKAINNNSYTLKLEDGKSYFVSIQAKDRNTGIANISAWSQPSRIVIDTSLPVVSDLKTVIKGNDKSINFNVLEKNFDSAYIQIYDINNQLVKTITNCNGKLCKDIDTSIITNLSFALDGLNNAGKELSDGNYRIEPVVIDKSKNQNANSTQVGGTNIMEADVNGVISKSPNILLISNSASIYIVNPINNSWTNKDTIKIEGSSGRVNSTDANGVSITKGIKQLDFAKLDLDGAGAISNGTALEKLPFNFFNNFSKEVKLDHGKNEFKLTSTDTNDAKNTKIGDPAKERVDSWVINREDIAPEIKSIKFNGNISIPTSIPTINDSKVNIEFTAMDNTDPNYSSGINTGINPKGFDISLLRSIDDNASFREIPLFKDGVNISDPNPNPRLAGDLKCDPIGLEVKCSFVADNLKLDANYILHLKVNDRAGNQACTKHYEYVEKALSEDLKCKTINPYSSVVPNYNSKPTREYFGYDLFKIKTFTYLNSNNSTDYEVLPGLLTNIPGGTTAQTFTGLKSASYSFDVEENAYLVYRNSNSKRMIIIDPKFPTFPLETDNSDIFPNFATAKNYYRQPDATLTNVTSVCGTSINHDLILETPNIKTCKVTFSVVMNIKPTPTAQTWDNQIVIYALNGVYSNLYKTNTTIDYSKYILGTSANATTLSPDGDGKFDTITFNVAHEYKGSENLLTTSDDVKFQIKDATGKVILEPDMKNVLYNKPYEFDGKANGKVLPDGQYTFLATMISRAFDGSRKTSTETKFSIVSNITAAMVPVIITPAPDFTTTRGVVTLQGNGVKSDPKNVNNTWTVEVCARLSNKSLVNTNIQAAIPANGCVYQSAVKTTNTGFYALLVTLPYANQTYDLEVKSVNPNGNQQSPIAKTKIIYNTPDSIQDLTVTSSIEGLNTADQMKCAFGNAATTTATIKCDTVNVNNLKTLKISTTVLKGVEGVELDFNDLTNLNALPTSDKNDYNNQYIINNGKRIAIINDLTDLNPKFNPTADARVKLNQAGKPIVETIPLQNVLTGKDLSYGSLRKPCLAESCTWTYYYVLPYQMAGGKYEIRARTYKGETVQQATASFEVNGIVKLAPKLIRAQKDVMTAKCQYLTTFDSSSAEAKACATGGTGNIESITLKSANSDAGTLASGAGVVASLANTSQAKLQTFYTNKPAVRLFVGGDLNTEFNYKLIAGNTVVADAKAVTTAKGLAELNLNLSNSNYGYNSLIITPYNSSTKALNTAEATAYNIVYDNTAPSIESVVTTNKSTTANTPSINPWIRNGDQINFDIKVNGLNSAGAGNALNLETIDYGYVISESGYREPLKLVANGGGPGVNTYQADLTIQREKLEGIYFPTIYLQDLAGNSSMVNNDVSKVLLNNIVNDNKPNLKKVSAGSRSGTTITSYDFDQVAYTNISGGTNSSTVNGITNGPSTYPTNPINNSGNLDGGRKASLDFSLLLDNTRPLRGDFNMIGVGDTVIEYDANTNSPKLNSSLQSTNTTRTGAIRTDGVLGSGNSLDGNGGRFGTNIPIGINGNGMIEVDRLVGQKTNNPNNTTANKEATNQGYSLVTRNNLVELRISAEKNTRLTLLLKEGKDSAGNLGAENAYNLEQTITPSSTSIDQSSCTTNPTSIAKLGVSRALGSTNQLFRLAGAKNGMYKPELQSVGTAPLTNGGGDISMVRNAYDNNLIPMLASDPRASSDKLGYSISGSANDRVVTQSATYCDIVFTYDFKNRTDAAGKKISDTKKVGTGESPNGSALEYFSLSFYSIDLAGNVNLSDEEYTKALNTPIEVSNGGSGKSDIRVYSNTSSSSNGAVQLFNELVSGTQSPTSNSSNNCAYNPTTGQLDPSIYSLDLASKLSDVIIPKVANSAFSCTVNVRYDAEAPNNHIPVSKDIFSSNGVYLYELQTKGLGIRTAISNITSSSYKNGDQQVSIPDLVNTEFNQNTSNDKNVAITRDPEIKVTTTAEARADMVYTMQSGYADSSNVLIQDGTVNPNGGLNGVNSNYKEFGTTLDIKSSKNQQSKQVVLKQDPSKVLLDKGAPYEWYYFFQSVEKSIVKVEQGRISNTTRVLQNGEQDSPTRTTSFVLGRNSTSKGVMDVNGVKSSDKRLVRDEDGSKKGIVNGAANSDCVKTTNDAITTSGLGTIPATVNRRVGVCDDGLYKINTYAVDTVGNVVLDNFSKPVLTSKLIERDTVSPGEAVISNTLNGDILGQTLSLGISGEANTIATIKVGIVGEKTNVNQVYGYRLDSSGKFSSSNLLGQLTCDTSYSLDITLTDRAGNVSKGINNTFRTMTCPVCPVYKVIDKSNETVTQGANSGKYRSPIRGAAAPVGLQLYGTPRSYEGRSWGHEGVDFNGAGNPPTYSIGTGVVVFARVNGLYGNMVKVDHGNGTRSEYGHLKSISVKEGQSVSIETQLGIVGSTGNSFGDHLHLNTYVNGKQVNPLTVLDTNYSYSPTVVEGNNRYAVLQLSPGTLSVDEARRFGCDVPSLPRDPALDNVYDFGGGGFDSTSDDDDLIELASVDSDQINVTEIIDKIAGDLRADFNYYFKLTTNCDWYNVDCHKANAVNLIDKVKRFLELLINGMIKGLQKAGSNLIQEFQNIFNTLKDLINDPIKTITEAVKEVQKMFENVLSMISKAGDFLKIIVNNIKDFITGDRESRITSLGSAFGLFIGEKIADAVKGVLSGGPIAAIANVIKGIIDKLKDIAKVVIKTIQLVGERIAFGVNGVVLTIKKSISNRVGILVSEVRKFSLEAIESLPLSPAHKSSLRDLRKFNDIYATLKTPDWMSRDRVQHVLMGHDGGGAHSLKSIGGGQSQFNGIKGVKNPNGTYKAEVSVFRAKTGKFEPKKTHTMFPDEWDQQTIIDSIVAAKEKADPSKWIKGGKNTSQDILHNNVTIKIVLYPDGTLCTAYPI